MVDDGTIDANYFQHKPYLDDFNTENGTHLVSVAVIHVEPMGNLRRQTDISRCCKEMIELKNLSKTFQLSDTKVEALRNISLTVNNGDIYGIIGMSGAGKKYTCTVYKYVGAPYRRFCAYRRT